MTLPSRVELLTCPAGFIRPLVLFSLAHRLVEPVSSIKQNLRVSSPVEISSQINAPIPVSVSFSTLFPPLFILFSSLLFLSLSSLVTLSLLSSKPMCHYVPDILCFIAISLSLVHPLSSSRSLSSLSLSPLYSQSVCFTNNDLHPSSPFLFLSFHFTAPRCTSECRLRVLKRL